MSDSINPIELQKSLAGVDYPASRDDLVEAAKGNGASDDILSALGDLGENSFEKPTDVSSAISGN